MSLCIYDLCPFVYVWLGSKYWNVYITICDVDDQSKFDAWNRAFKAGALGRPRGGTGEGAGRVCMYRWGKESSLLVLRCWWLMKFRPSSGVCREAGSCPHICWHELLPHLLSGLLPGFTCCSGEARALLWDHWHLGPRSHMAVFDQASLHSSSDSLFPVS